jgi:hypothetical protein
MSKLRSFEITVQFRKSGRRAITKEKIDGAGDTLQSARLSALNITSNVYPQKDGYEIIGMKEIK